VDKRDEVNAYNMRRLTISLMCWTVRTWTREDLGHWKTLEPVS